jgi:glutathione S-transferase
MGLETGNACEARPSGYDSAMRLYVLYQCPFGHRAAIALREKNLPFELAFFEAGKRPPELAAVGPRAKSPTLFDTEAKVHDSQVVLEYIEDRYPTPALMPNTPSERAEVRMFIARVNDELMPKYGGLISELLFKPERDSEKIAEAEQAFLKALATLHDHFAGRSFAVGNAISLADITLYTLFPSLQRHAGIQIPTELEHLRTWFDRMQTRPAFALPTPT